MAANGEVPGQNNSHELNMQLSATTGAHEPDGLVWRAVRNGWLVEAASTRPAPKSLAGGPFIGARYTIEEDSGFRPGRPNVEPTWILKLVYEDRNGDAGAVDLWRHPDFDAAKAVAEQYEKTGVTPVKPDSEQTTYGWHDGFDYDSFDYTQENPPPQDFVVMFGMAHFRGPDGHLWFSPDPQPGGQPQNVALFDREHLEAEARDGREYLAVMSQVCAAVDAVRGANVEYHAALSGVARGQVRGLDAVAEPGETACNCDNPSHWPWCASVHQHPGPECSYLWCGATPDGDENR